jgi:hypothetical protein
VNWEAGELDVLGKHGLKAMVHAPTPELATRLKDHRAVWGYHLGDEPYPETAFPPLAAQVRALESADPTHPAFINMLSTTGDFLRTYMKVVRPRLLSFDYYQWWWGSDRYFEKLEEFREAALAAGVPLMACFEVSANPGIEWGDTTRVADNDRKLRQSVFTSLAYGVTGLEWFNADMVFEADTGVLTPAGRDVAALNREVRPIGDVLAGLRSIGVFHAPATAAGTRSAPREHWVQVVGEEGRAGFVLGAFKDDADVDYVLVANRDYREAQSAVVKLQSKWLGIAPWYLPKEYRYAIDRFDRASGRWTALSSSSAVGFSYIVGAADGELFRITTTVTREGKASR